MKKNSVTADYDTQTLPGHFSDMNHDRDHVQTEETSSVLVKFLRYQHTGELLNVLEKNSCKVLKIHLLNVGSQPGKYSIQLSRQWKDRHFKMNMDGLTRNK